MFGNLFCNISFKREPLSPSILIVIVKFLSLGKASFPIFVTLLGISTEVKLRQPLKAFFSIFLTLLGIITEVKLMQT